MTQQSIGATGKDRRHPSRLFAAQAKTKRIDTAMDRMQNTSLDSPLDRTSAETDGQELSARDKAVLLPGDRRNEPVHLTTAPFTTCTEVNGAFAFHGSIVLGADIRVAREM